MKKLRFKQFLLSAVLLFSVAHQANAMKIAEFTQICGSAPIPCADIPFIQAYVGGALDLLAALDEDTEYLADMYCKPARELFNTAKIIKFMEAHQNEDPSRNAMMLVIQYVEEEGGCS